jgi:hypothetical protein
MGVENLLVGSTDELFSIVYNPATRAIYLALKEKMLTKDFVYSYFYSITKYYENSEMRIGINDISNTIRAAASNF